MFNSKTQQIWPAKKKVIDKSGKIKLYLAGYNLETTMSNIWNNNHSNKEISKDK